MKYKIPPHLWFCRPSPELRTLSCYSLKLVLECQAHLVPGYVAVDGCGDAFIYESELCVVMDELILAGQHQSFAALGFCIGDGTLDEVSGIAMFAVLRDGVDAEDHLPGTGFLVELGALIHFIGQVSCIGNHAVYKSNELTFIKHEPEMITVMGKAV